MDVNQGIATADYVERSLVIAKERNASLVVIRMDTPGGLDSAMRDESMGRR